MKNTFIKASIIVMLIALAFQFTNAQCIKTYDNDSFFGKMYNEYALVPVRKAVPLADEITKPVKVFKDISFNFMKSGSAKYLILNMKLNSDLALGDKTINENDAITLNFGNSSSFNFKPNKNVPFFGIDDFSRTAICVVKITDELKSQLQESVLTEIVIGEKVLKIKKSKGKKLIKSCCYLG